LVDIKLKYSCEQNKLVNVSLLRCLILGEKSIWIIKIHRRNVGIGV